MIARRGFIAGLTSLLATPALVRASNIMPVSAVHAFECSSFTDLSAVAKQLHLELSRANRRRGLLHLDGPNLIPDGLYQHTTYGVDVTCNGLGPISREREILPMAEMLSVHLAQRKQHLLERGGEVLRPVWGVDCGRFRSVRVVRAYDILTDSFRIRADILAS